MPRLLHVLPLLLLAACAQADADGDGYDASVDCDDSDPAIHPGAIEICDGVDQDCDGSFDEAATDAGTWYADDDGDSFGLGSPFITCSVPDTGWSVRRGDCDDDDASVFPGAEERCDERDQDCDGEIDEGFVCGERQCDDGLDDDQDGAIDCADPDCDGACPETCADGRDNDLNGAIDCADEACWGAAGCIEADCQDSIDNEADGLTDCADPDCWADPRCPAALWRVTGGSLSVSRETISWTEKGCEGQDCARGVDRVQDIQAYEVSGELLREVDGELVLCAFSYEEGRFYARIEGGTPAEEEVWREGFSIEPGCGIADSRFLPRSLTLSAEAVHTTEGDAWFQGDRFEASVRESDLEDPDRSGRVVRDLAFWDPLRPAPALGRCAEGQPVLTYADADSDGVGASGPGRMDCEAGAGVASPGDCDDADPARPASTEICGNGLDDDCDGAAPDCDGPGGIADLGAPDGAWLASLSTGVPRVFDLGDLDGDGVADVVLGVPAGDRSGEDAGGIVLFDDGLQASSLEAGVWLDGVRAGDVAGAAISNLGDATGDGRADLLITAPGVVTEGVSRSGAAYVVAAPFETADLTAPHALITGAGLWLGTDAASLGDADGDGLLSFAIGAQTDPAGGTNAGSILVFDGDVSGSVSTDQAASILLGRRNDIVGDAVAGPGDVDGDGQPDLLVGRRKADTPASEAGAAHLWLGPLPARALVDEADATWTGALTDAWAGERVAAAGDVNGDGYRDLLVGAPRTWGVNPRAIAATGEVYLIAGSALPEDGALQDATAVIRGDRIYDFAGVSLAGGRDMDGDGLHDIAIGAPGDDRGGPQAGVVAVFTGPIEGRLRLSDADGLYRGRPGTQVGTWVALVGDMTGDGRSELLTSGLAPDGSGRGQVFGVVGGPGW